METVSDDILAARAKLRQKFGDGARVGGKGGARIKKRPVPHKSAAGDDKKLLTQLRRMNLSTLPGVDEVAMLKDDGKAIVFHHPKVQANLNANTFAITGASEEKSIDQLPAVPEFDPEMLKQFAAEWQKMQAAEKQNAAESPGDKCDEDDDDVPDLVEDFEAVADS